MKHLLLFYAVFFCAENSFSQVLSQKTINKHLSKVYESKTKGSVVLSLDTIYNKGVPYAILRKKKQIPYFDYTLFSLSNEELVQIISKISINKDKTPYYCIFFDDSERSAEVEKYYGYQLEKEIVENNLVINNQVDPFNETKFLIKFPCRFSDTTIKAYISDYLPEDKIDLDNIYETVKRDQSAEFFCDEGKIVQDYTLIGFYKILGSRIRFYLTHGLEIAEATEKEPGSGEWTVTSMKDHKSWGISPDPGKVLTNMAKFLTEKSYL